MTGEQQRQHSEGAVSDPVVPSTGAADAEWEARLEALRQLADTNAASAREQAQAALEELLGQQRLALEARFSWLVGHCYVLLAKKVEAAVALHRAVSIAQAIGRIDLEAHHLTTLGVAQAMMSAYSEAIECYERALGLHKGLPPSADNDLILAKVQCNFGATYSFMGLPEKALPLYQQASDLFMRLGRARDGTACLGNCALVHMDRAERLSRQPSADERVQAAAAASEARALAERVVADPSMGPEDGASIIARLTLVRAHIVLGDCAAAIEELSQIDPHLTSDAHGAFFRVDRSTLRARLLRLSGRASEAIAELQTVPLDDLSHADRVSVLEELIATQEAAGDLAGALTSFRRYHLQR